MYVSVGIITFVLTAIDGNVIATKTLPNQLVNAARDIAGGRGPCLNSSAPRNCGMEPSEIQHRQLDGWLNIKPTMTILKFHHFLGALR